MISKFISTCFYIGLLPRFHATVASLLGFGLFQILFLVFESPHVPFIAYGILFFAGCASVYFYQKISGTNDPKEIVMDEFLSSGLIPFFFFNTIYYGIGTLALYRVIDLLKPGFLKKFDSMNHWSYILLDDIFAVAISIVVVKGIQYSAGAL
jgi:phosphatidylglycerophosphatase A